jgi:acetyl esterase/lipase
MPSLRARLVNRYIRTTMKPKRLDEIDPPVLRAWTERRALRLLPRGVRREEVAGKVRGEWVKPERGGKRTILYLHGGGYVFGSPRLYRSLTYPLALTAEANLFAPVYRLAPEHRCPAALEDALAAYDWLIAQAKRPSEIVLGGDSAGAGLALATLIALRSRGSIMPAGAVLFSPWVDLALTGETIAANAMSDAMFNRRSIEGGRWKYLGRLDPKDPRASPLYADLAGLPPLLVFASKSEMLYSDATRLCERAIAAGVDVELTSHDNLVHIWPLFHPLMPEARDTIAASAAFVRRRTGEGTAR